ncbi:hypothetical protein N7457_002005 [Penicillium paradoxum]|uniref:uncharacterized protein n=1 Tax=Penicillium paradoxum TaxID=176176 RepID=UPI002548952F|nr:uncharacterized protein N7457_002005 [Penicillium paradoxum]KAJ5787015.1 hypothetical protein N7457_002005 [Penicillium paradoxum]
MEDLPPGSRLAAVRSQLAIDIDAEKSTCIAASSPETEAFPQYDEAACDDVASFIAAEKPKEEAWIYACGKFAQQQIRLNDVDPNIIPFVPSDPSDPSQVALEKLRNLLADPQMRDITRRQFITLLNTTLELNSVIFHQSAEFLAPKEVSDAKTISKKILTDLTWMDTLLKEQLQSTNRITAVLERISLQDISPFDKFRKMAALVAETMKKPRALERRLLFLYMDVFEEWVHSPFLRLRCRQVLINKTIDPPRSELACHIVAIRDIISSCIEGYALFTWATKEIKTQYFAPTMTHLCESSEVWTKCWEDYQEAEKKQREPAERDPHRSDTL